MKDATSEPMNLGPVSSIRKPSKLLLIALLFSIIIYSENTKILQTTLSFNYLLKLAKIVRLTTTLEALGTQVDF
jgi:hypothetical protein